MFGLSATRTPAIACQAQVLSVSPNIFTLAMPAPAPKNPRAAAAFEIEIIVCQSDRRSTLDREIRKKGFAETNFVNLGALVSKLRLEPEHAQIVSADEI